MTVPVGKLKDDHERKAVGAGWWRPEHPALAEKGHVRVMLPISLGRGWGQEPTEESKIDKDNIMWQKSQMSATEADLVMRRSR